MGKFMSMVVLIACFWGAGNAFATDHFIAANGSDSNPGTQQSPWAHAPGMGACTANCASYTPAPGDRFIFRGGDTWNMADFYQWHWTWSGTASNPIYIGVDTSWFSGSSWARPILNGNNLDSSQRAPWVVFGADYVTFDNFEFTGLYAGGACGYSVCTYLNYGSSSTYITVEHCYFHGWSHAPAGTATDGIVIVLGDSHSPTQNVGCVFAYNVIDGSDSTNGGDSGAAVFHGPPIIYGNYITNVSNGLETQGTDVHDNTIGPVNQSFDSTSHENGIEQLGTSPGGGNYGEFYYNNVVYTTTAVNAWFIPGGNVTQYVFNNVFYNTSNANVFNVAPGNLGGTSGPVNAFNNTIECGRDPNPSVTCITGTNASNSSGSLYSNNEHLITSGATYICNNLSPCNHGPNDVQQTASTANGQGYTISNKFAPTSSSGSTVGKGANLTNTYCTSMLAAATGFGGASAATDAEAACQKDTTLGVGYDKTNHKVILPARTPNSRPASGAWDVGAYQYGAGSATAAPNPPTGLSAIVH